MDSRWSPWIPGGIIQFFFCFGIPPGVQVESMFPCGICGVHLESMGEGKVHVMSNVKEPRGVDDGKKTRGKACESGWCPCDSRRKIQPSGISGGRAHVSRDARRLKFSVR